jgi:DNA replication protein DnaC
MKRNHLLEEYLKRLKLPTMAREYPKVAKEAAVGSKSYEEFLLVLVEQEALTREQNAIKRSIKKAGFPRIKTIDEFNFTAVPGLKKQKVLQLGKGNYVEERENVVLVGNNGTGKTHLAISLGVEACRQGHKVKFFTAAGLINTLNEAQSERRLLSLEKQLRKVGLLIIDELGYIPLTKTGAQLLFEVFADRYERGSIMVTTNLEFGEWVQVFGEEKLTAALLDRLTHRCNVLVMNGESYRFKESQRRLRKEVA